MANDNNIRHFNAADIEKYLQGKLSAAEMHVMEKAAMDDPFLADALEGYAVAGVDRIADIADLKNRLQEKTGSARVVKLSASPRRSFQLLRVAVIIAFIAGAGLLIYQLGFNNKSNKELAQAKNEPAVVKLLTDSTTPVGSATQPESIKTNNSDHLSSTLTKPVAEASRPDAPKLLTHPEKGQDEKPSTEKSVTTGNTNPADGAVSRSFEPAPVISSPASGAGEKSNKPVAEDKFGKSTTRDIAHVKLNEKDKDKLKDQEEKTEQALYRKEAGKNQRQENFAGLSNNFRGQITDSRNIGVPFANVTNITDNNAGTYTDARGYFNLTYPDSVLSVQVRSIGFENKNVQLRNNVPTNQVILQDDRNSLSEVVVSKQKLNSATRNRDSNMKLDEPEPADGWEKYDTYLLNNNSLQDEVKEGERSNGTVLLSFEVNKNGVPTNIKVEKSLCKDCDEEAIRLIKQGPKWKRNAKKGRTTITIPFTP